MEVTYGEKRMVWGIGVDNPDHGKVTEILTFS